MYYLNGRIDYNEIVTMPRRTTEPPPAPCYDDGMDQCAMFMKCVMYTYKESPPGAASWLELVQLFQTSDISPELISCANGLRF